MFKNKEAVFFLTVAFISAAAFFSEARAEAGKEPQENGDFYQTVDSYFRFMPSRSLKAQAGEIRMVESGSEYKREFKVGNKLPVKFSLSNNYIGIENTSSLELPKRLVGLSVDIETTVPFLSLEDIYLRLGLSPSFYGDDWDFSASEFRIPSRAFFIYLPDKKWVFLFGLAVYPDFERKLLPVLGFIYRPNHKLAFNITPKRPNISYLLNDKITLFAEAGSSFNSEFEVAKGALKSAVLGYSEKHLGLGAKYKFNKFTEASVSAGGSFGRYLKYRDSLGKANIKNGAYAEFRLKIEI